MILGGKIHNLLSEAATADMLDVSVSSTVKDTVEELEDTLTNNIEEVPEEDMSTNNAELLLTPEMCIVRESNGYFSGGQRHMIELEQVIRLCEEEEAQAVENGADPEEVQADAGEVAADVAEKNDIPEADVVVVVNSEMASLYAEMALLEAKSGRKGKGTKKLNQMVDAIDDIKNKGIKVVKTAPKNASRAINKGVRGVKSKLKRRRRR